MNSCWLARTSHAPGDAFATATLHDEHGTAAGVLCAWERHHEHPETAVKIDARAIDAHGAEAWASLALVDPREGLPFDDPAVLEAMRVVLALPAPDVFSTFVVHDNECAGALTAVYDLGSGRLGRDPFRFVFGGQQLHIGAGLLAPTPPATGPAVQRYGSSSPWPWDRFPQPK